MEAVTKKMYYLGKGYVPIIQVHGTKTFRVCHPSLVPNIQKDKIILENVKGRDTKLVKSIQNLSYL